MKAETIELDIPLLLPEIESARDQCVRRLEGELEHRRGVLRAHVKYNGDPARLCIHYNPELVSLGAVERIAHDAGASITDRYPHKTIPFAGLDAADVAASLEDALAALPGMLHARVNYAAGVAQAARNGVLIKGGVHLENLGSLRAMAFDKTGTLTQAEFRLTDLVPLGAGDEEALLQVAAAVEQQSNHPLALAVVRAAEARGLALPSAGGLENVTGRGVRSSIDGEPVLVGSLKLFRETEGHPLPAAVVERVQALEAAGKTTMAVSRAGHFLGVITLADVARPGVRQTLQQLQALGVRHLVMLTGDNDDVARQIAGEVGVTDVRAELLPAQKLEAIQALQAQYGKVATGSTTPPPWPRPPWASPWAAPARPWPWRRPTWP